MLCFPNSSCPGATEDGNPGGDMHLLLDHIQKMITHDRQSS